jgi:HSP20 family protein
MSVMRFDPFREFDRMAEQMLGQAGRRGGALTAPMDAYRGGDRFFVHLDLPGVDPASVELTTEQNVLTIRAERRFPTQEDDQIVVSERPQGSFTRQLFLSDALLSQRRTRYGEHQRNLRPGRTHARAAGRRAGKAPADPDLGVRPRAGNDRGFGQPQGV